MIEDDLSLRREVNRIIECDPICQNLQAPSPGPYLYLRLHLASCDCKSSAQLSVIPQYKNPPSNFLQLLPAGRQRTLEPTTKTVLEFTTQLRTKIEPLYDTYLNIQTQIECVLTDETEIRARQAEFTIFEAAYFDLIGKAKQYINQREVASIQASLPANNGSGVSSAGNDSRNAFLRLPTITLPTFEGSYEKWLQFRDSFRSIIHENVNLSDIDKFHYLCAAVKGDASRAIQSFSINSENYTLAWEALTRRFEDKRLIIHDHLKAFFNVPAIGRQTSEGLQELYDDAANHLSSLRNLGESVQHWDTLIIYTIASKLDPQTRSDWEEKHAKLTSPKWSELSNFMMEQCRLIKTKSECQATTNNNQRQTGRMNTKSKGPTASHVATTKQSCACCRGTHAIHTCEKFAKLPIAGRLALIRETKGCFNCLRTGNTSKQCKAGDCRRCGKRHNTMLHLETTDSSDYRSKDQDKRQAAPDRHTQEGSSKEAVISAKCSYKRGSHVFLSTAIVHVASASGSQLECRMLLDNGSQPNFITQATCDKLKLKPNRVQIPVAGIARMSTDIQHQVEVKIRSRTGIFEASIECLIIPEITEELPSIPVSKEMLRIPDDIVLADPDFNETRRVDILLGGAFFWDIMCIGQIRLLQGQPS
ncbi:uncharacterized protein [Prorops nasuta]|uniref:uncharacterized protein n=1 Tax=Prorops nasuta TaxID=863751 RepID=UPI0034CDF54F